MLSIKEKKAAKQKAYFRTKNGLITKIYGKQKHKSRLRNHPEPTYTNNELKEWLFNLPEFHIIYDNWVKLNYQKDYIPSIDRIKDSLPYTLTNIQIMTWKENNEKHYNDVKEAVGQYDLNLNLLRIHESGIAAGLFINSHATCISKCLVGKRKTHKGFIWKKIKERK